MPNLTGDPNQPVNVTIRALEPTDQAIPDLWNVPFQQFLNNDANLNQRVSSLETSQGGTTLAAHRTASVLDHPDGSVTAEKLAPVRNAPTITPSPGDWLLGGLASGIGVGKLPIGQPNGVPLLNAIGALASADAYLNRGIVASPLNWNILTTAGVYAVYAEAFGAGSANTPPTTYLYGTLLVLASGPSSEVIAQIYIPHTADGAIYFRQYFNAWSPWYAAGATYGSNSNGSYIRFSDGTQICWAKQTSAEWGARTQASASVDGITVYTKDIPGLTFPAAFIAEPAIAVGGDVTGLQLKSFMAYSPSASGFNITASYQINGASIFSYYIAIGRWK